MPQPPELLARLISLVKSSNTSAGFVHINVPPPPPKPGAPFDFNRRIESVSTPCYAVPGAKIELLIESGAWSPTGQMLVSCEDDVAALLERFPDYPFARVELPPLPELTMPAPPGMSDWKEALSGHVAHLRALSDAFREEAAWLEQAIEAITVAVEEVKSAGEELRDTVAMLRHDRWHITSIDSHHNTVNLLGHTYQVSFGEPVGSAQDLKTLFLWQPVDGFWKGKGRPLIRLKSASYGTKMLSITLGRRGSPGKTYWIDLGALSINRQS